MGLFDGLPNPAAPALAFQQGMERGRTEREEREVKGALSAYVTNPDDPQAFATLAQHRPDIALKLREDDTKRRLAATQADLQRRAAGGDRTARAQLAGIDIEAWDKLEDNDRQTATERAAVVGQAALRISQLPPEQRPAAWDQTIDQLAPRYPELAEYKGQYSEEALMSAIDGAKLVNDFFMLERPRYQAVPLDNALVNTNDPAAVAAFASGQGTPTAPVRVNTPQEAAGLPPGTRFVDPNGIERVVPGGPAPAPGNFPR
jgi:hypothetical protein